MVSILKRKKDIQKIVHEISHEKGNQKSSFFYKLLKSIKNNTKYGLRNVLLSKIFHRFFKIFVIVTVFSALLYGGYLYINSSVENNVVVSKSEIIARVGKLTPIPTDQPQAVVRVEDAETLKKQNSFYENVKNGDYIIMYPTLAIIYDLLNNNIVSVKKIDKETLINPVE